METVKDIEIYQTAGMAEPFTDWIESLRDGLGRAAIRARIRRACCGNLGNHKSVGKGVIELCIPVGPGYRVYVGLHGERLIVLLCGGDKVTQSKDVALAHAYWSEWRRS